ncbi:lipocalin-like domain-containing protein [Epilithonimonas hispanica]|uniref:Lipocalin-like domain-containing protein n=1 Tax=Epilithonimonas hispanica TaxID=358687 RepID=A0A3D9CP11_9FLAO|nr:lipocalin family protein [Epilithonimonas hispanica]REC67347.1 hypothetical protein DRF58_15360 [Epilithonimonas hispanica]
MKKYIIIGLALSLLSCGENQKTEQSNTENNPSEQIAKTFEEITKEADINGKWQITKVSGEPVKIYPSGKSNPGMEIDFNPIWKGGTYEFTNGICFLTLPNTPKDQIGGYKVKGNTIIFDNTEGEEQQMTFTLDGNTMTLSINSEAYQKLIKQKSNEKVEMDISNPLVFHLKK